jgi:methionyl-tRNA formyltransferase
MSSRPRLVFMGTPDLAATVFRALVEDGGYDIPLVVVQPDKPVGRGLQLQSPPVKIAALEHGIPVSQPLRARDQALLDSLRAIQPDVVAVAAYGQILPAELLAIPKFGCLNVHTSILPRWRGAAPIQWALLEGDSETGVTIMRMDVGLDTGDVIATEKTPISAADTGASLHDRLATLGAALLRQTLPRWIDGQLRPVPQAANGVTYARKLTKEDGRLSWSDGAAALDRRVRAFNPWPGAFTTLSDAPAAEPNRTALLKIWSARPVVASGAPGEIIQASGDDLVVGTGDGGLRIEVLQREGRRRMTARECLAGGTLKLGMRLGSW